MNSRIFLFLFLLVLKVFPAFSQMGPDVDLKIKRGEFKTTLTEGFQDAWKSVKAGNKYFEAGVG
ncbi:MAG: hypothetical protein ACOCZL_01430, partial [Bacteroidota bacterium]